MGAASRQSHSQLLQFRITSVAGHHQFCANVWQQCRRSGSSQRVEHISIDEIVLEDLNSSDEIGSSNSSQSPLASESGTHTADQYFDATIPVYQAQNQSTRSGYIDVSSVDTFAKSRVLNFLRRIDRTNSGIYASRENHFDVTEEGTSSGDDHPVFRCRLRIPLPPPHGTKIAQGLAETASDAEILAAMHGERIIDACGFHLFALPSKQIRHAEEMKKVGRWAPLPTEKPLAKTPDILPPPLRMISLTAEAATGVVERADGEEGGGIIMPYVFPFGVLKDPRLSACANISEESIGFSPGFHTSMLLVDPGLMDDFFFADNGTNNRLQDQSEGGIYTLCNLTSMRFSPHESILCAAVFDPNSRRRVTECLRHFERDFESLIRSTYVMIPGSGFRMYQIEVQLFSSISKITARGKAVDKEKAIDLCAMHAEMLIDYLGLPLFPGDATKQLQHAKLLAGWGRWATTQCEAKVPRASALELPGHLQLGEMQWKPELIDPASPSYPYHIEAPPWIRLPRPIKQMFVRDEATDETFGRKGSVATLDWSSTRRSTSERLIDLHGSTAARLHGTLLEVYPNEPEYMKYCEQLLAQFQRRAGNRYPDMFVYTKLGTTNTSSDKIRCSSLLTLPRAYKQRGGLGIGFTPEHSRQLCAMHSVEVLCHLGFYPTPAGNDIAKKELHEWRLRLGLTNMLEPPEHPAPPDTPSPCAFLVEGIHRPLPLTQDAIYAAKFSYDNYVPLPGLQGPVPGDIEIGNRAALYREALYAYQRRYALAVGLRTPLTDFGILTENYTVSNIRFWPFFIRRGEATRRVMAMGVALKKKDAERLCVLHAVAILKKFGIDVKSEKFEMLQMAGNASKKSQRNKKIRQEQARALGLVTGAELNNSKLSEEEMRESKEINRRIQSGFEFETKPVRHEIIRDATVISIFETSAENGEQMAVEPSSESTVFTENIVKDIKALAQQKNINRNSRRKTMPENSTACTNDFSCLSEAQQKVLAYYCDDSESSHQQSSRNPTVSIPGPTLPWSQRMTESNTIHQQKLKVRRLQQVDVAQGKSAVAQKHEERSPKNQKKREAIEDVPECRNSTEIAQVEERCQKQEDVLKGGTKEHQTLFQANASDTMFRGLLNEAKYAEDLTALNGVTDLPPPFIHPILHAQVQMSKTEKWVPKLVQPK